LYEDAKNRVVDVIYITLPMKSEDRIKEIIRDLADTTVSVYFVPDLFVFDMVHARWNILQGLPTVSVYESPFQSFDSFIKRQMDIILSIIILTIIALPMLVIALAVRVSSSGPVLFRQRRYGIRGEEIEVWKFRTMEVCEDGADIKQAVRNDPRVTRLGRFLRRTSLDELPQFINVLQGRMSIVGPRPHAVSHNEYYRNLVHGYMLRHKVRPGITGLAQVHGYRGETENIEKMQKRILYDLEYIRHWSPWLDIKIIFLTIFKGFSAKDVY
jgi:putative colanic acid biosysnthesis UDP-glucose lipid carrier transferase